MAMLARSARTTTAERILAVLDIGTSKVCCMIFAVDTRAVRRRNPGDAAPVRMLGIGLNRSHGMKAGVVVDLAEAERSIRRAVGRAEEQAGTTVEEVVLSAACGRLKSQAFAASAKVERTLVTDADIGRALKAGRAFAERDGRVLLHLHRTGYRLDGEAGIRNPRGMAGARLSVELKAVTADEPPLRNLKLLIERCFLTVGAIVAAPYASALAAATLEELQLGVTVIDMGAGTTTFAVFGEGHFQQAGAIVVGGGQLSLDIARSLSTPLYEAERIKTLYGNLAGAASDEQEIISYPLAGERPGELAQTTRARLRRTIRPSIEETLRLVRERFESSVEGRASGSRVVLTGGASQLAGLSELAEQLLGRPVRVAPAQPLAGVPESALSPAFATVTGLVHAVFVPDIVDGLIERPSSTGERRGYLGQMGQWLRESFWDEERPGGQGSS